MNDQNGTLADDHLIREEMVAYLDGELDADAARRVEQRLAKDAEYRRRLQQMEQAWDLLDELPRTDVDESFTKTTIEMVTVAASEEVFQAQAAANRRNWLAWCGAGVGVATAAVAGYLMVAVLAERSDDRLLRDLPVIENVDLYKHADSVDFLRRLLEERVF